MLHFRAKNYLFDLEIELTKLFEDIVITASKSQYSLLEMTLICHNIKKSEPNSVQEDVRLVWDAIDVMVVGIVEMKRKPPPLEVFRPFKYPDHLPHLPFTLQYLILLFIIIEL
jgi:hypothetical protein